MENREALNMGQEQAAPVQPQQSQPVVSEQPVSSAQPEAASAPVGTQQPQQYAQYPPYYPYGQYYTYQQYPQYAYSWPNPGPDRQKPQKSAAAAKGSVKRLIAGLAAVALLVAMGCGITAAVVKSICDGENVQLQQVIALQQDKIDHMDQLVKSQTLNYEQKLAALEKKLQQSQTAPGQSTTGEFPQGTMTPAQLYAQCVSGVVAISNQAAAPSGSVTTVGTGSGFILSEDGYIVSNHHVVDGADKLLVTLSNGLEYEAKLIGSDNINDVALLKVDTQEKLPAVQIGSSDALQIGDQVVAIGNPLGDLTATATVGYISGKDRPVNTDGTVIDMLQTDAAINSGNSGGPLFNMYGQVVGITTAKYSGTTGSGASIEGIGFAIPMDDVIGMLTDLRDHGYVTGGYLGVVVSSMDPEVAKIYNLPVGAYVREVTEGSCAQKAGVQVEDIIISLGGYDVENLTDLTRALRNFQAGDQVAIEVYRGGATVTVTAVLDEKPRS